MTEKLQNLKAKAIEDAHGKVVLWQKPNLPIITWGVCTILVWLVPTGQAEDLLRLIAFGALFTWAWLEIFYGVNYIRRAGGAIVMVVTLLNRM